MFAVLHLADFALQAVLRTEHDAHAGEPAALFDSTKKKSLALAVNAAARAAGVDAGMTAPQAVARCPSLVIRTPDSAAETEARAALLATGFLLSPTIEDTAPGVCTIDLKGADLERTTVAAEAAVAELARLDLSAVAGIGRTPLLALYAARSNRFAQQPRNPKHETQNSEPTTPNSEPRTQNPEPSTQHPEFAFVTEGAADYGASKVVHVVTDEKGFLAPLPLSTAEPPPVLADVFAGWGIRTLGEFTALPRDEIVRRFGHEGLAFWRRAMGGEPRPLRPVTPPQEFSAGMLFEETVETLEPLLFILRRFVERLSLELRAAQFVAAEISLTLILADDNHLARSFRLPEPTADTEILFRALHSHLESLHTDSPIAGVQLRVTPARPLVRQQGLFETGLRDPHGFAETLARVVAIVGSNRVGTPKLEDTHRPDAVTLVPPAAVVPPPVDPPVHPPIGLPLRRYRPPLPATLELMDGKPTYVSAGHFHGAIVELRGPWRSSGDWWQSDRVWHRIEYDIALADGGLYRLLRIGDEWFVEGEYD